MTDQANRDHRFTDVVDLLPAEGADRFTGPPAPERSGRTYGGQLLAQAVMAGHLTVPDDRLVNALHGLFLSAGEVDQPTAWVVERVRDGRSFGTRSVSGFQSGRELCRVLLSFHVPEPGLAYEPPLDPPMAAIPPPDEVQTTYLDFCRAHPDTAAADWGGDERPMDIRYIDPPDPTGGPPVTEPQRMWLRIEGQLPDDRAVHQAGLAYLADATLIDHVLLPHGHRWHDARLTGVSLDHAMWFRSEARADRWLRYDQGVEATAAARGLGIGRFHDETGTLIASCAQEGLMRWSEPD
ncbi:MAG: acyl-CoA thioesterase domain-containing protein [Actinomycetota bacterium]